MITLRVIKHPNDNMITNHKTSDNTNTKHPNNNINTNHKKTY